jgi:hypothetical protein
VDPLLEAINRWIAALSERKTDDARIEVAQRAAPQALAAQKFRDIDQNVCPALFLRVIEKPL